MDIGETIVAQLHGKSNFDWVFVGSKEEAVRQTTATLQRHREDREAVRRLFKNEKVRYAAE